MPVTTSFSPVNFLQPAIVMETRLKNLRHGPVTVLPATWVPIQPDPSKPVDADTFLSAEATRARSIALLNDPPLSTVKEANALWDSLPRTLKGTGIDMQDDPVLAHTVWRMVTAKTVDLERKVDIFDEILSIHDCPTQIQNIAADQINFLLELQRFLTRGPANDRKQRTRLIDAGIDFLVYCGSLHKYHLSNGYKCMQLDLMSEYRASGISPVTVTLQPRLRDRVRADWSLAITALQYTFSPNELQAFLENDIGDNFGKYLCASALRAQGKWGPAHLEFLGHLTDELGKTLNDPQDHSSAAIEARQKQIWATLDYGLKDDPDLPRLIDIDYLISLLTNSDPSIFRRAFEVLSEQIDIFPTENTVLNDICRAHRLPETERKAGMSKCIQNITQNMNAFDARQYLTIIRRAGYEQLIKDQNQTP